MKAILSLLIQIIKSIYAQLILLPISYSYYVLHLRRTRSYHLIVCNHIGDFLFTLGYVNAFKEQHHLSDLTIIAAPKFKPLFDRFEFQNITFCACSAKWINRLEEVNRYVSGRLMCRKLADVLIVAPGNDYVMGFQSVLPIANIAGFTLRNLLAYENLKLLPTAKYESIPMPNTDEKKRMAILLCPDAQMMHWPEKNCFIQMLQAEVELRGYQVIINSPLCYKGLADFLDCCSEYVAIVGLRSGLLDLAANSGTFTVALYPPEYEAYMSFYDIEKMNPNTSCAQYLLTDDMSYDVEQILNMCEV